MEPPVSIRSTSVKIAQKEDRDDDKLPPLLSMVIEGLPSFAESQYVHEAELYFNLQNVNRYADLPSWHSFCRQGLSFAGYCHPGVISLDRLVALSTFYALAFLLDDLFFDTPDIQNDLMEPYGIDRSALSSLPKLQEYLDHLIAVLGQQLQQSSSRPPHSTLIETMMCEVGREMLALSNSEWFQEFLLYVTEFCHVSVASHADLVAAGQNSSCFQDLQSFTEMRAVNSGGKFVVLLTEYASDNYIPTVLRSTDPYVQKATIATSIHIAFVNDVFSYHKESTQEENSRNLVTVLMAAGEGGSGKSSLDQATQQAIDLVNQYAASILELQSEVEAAASDSDSVLQNHAREIRALVAGTVYFNCMCERYRQPDSVFPELRDRSTSWKAFLESSSAVMPRNFDEMAPFRNFGTSTV